METLILDIETVGEEWDSLDALTQDDLLRWVRRSARSEKEQATLEKDVREGLGFSPLTGKIVALGLYDFERTQGIVYYQGTKGTIDYTEGEFAYRVRSEREMLEDFWDGARTYDTFVTFNGRRFDVPFLYLRSAIHGIRPTQNLMEGRYLYQQKSVTHIDLQDQLTFYGAMYRKPSLHLFTRAFGIQSPKAEEMSGDTVTKAFREEKYRDIAEYNARDVAATTALYAKWRTYLASSDSTTEPEVNW